MNKLFLAISLLLVLTPVFGANGSGPMITAISAQLGNESPIRVVNQSQLRNQISTTIQSRNQTRLIINQTDVFVNSTFLIVNATQAQKQLRISNQEMIVNGLQLTNESTNISAQVRAMISTLQGIKNIDIIQEQNRVQLRDDDCDCEVQLALNNQLRLQDNQLILNFSGIERDVAVLPIQVMNQLRATNQTVRSMELVMEQERAVYKVQETRQVRLFGLIPIGLSVESRVDATSGELISSRRPWWSFLTIE